ncbi:hypothetical protein [Flagellimonas marinaquae]|uniref:hypothetical protein n=1 Tax=Flagellimonas marinaquae TaxID=254955 RepID=UPI002074E927|nr:hypothetical protein [Allomuricauda aquimarina]USD25494.1 hypothetical protein MJO53_01010 [Allomuricauda aquimarina]
MKISFKEKLLVVSVGLIYCWFGGLKFFPNLSPAEDLAKNTIHQLTLGLIPDQFSILILAIGEVTLGVLLIVGFMRQQAVVLSLIHMACTFLPLFFFPGEVFGEEPLSLTLLGQYILKNLIIVAALVSVYEKKTTTARRILEKEIPKQSLVTKVWVTISSYK